MLDGSYFLSTALSFVGYSPNQGFARTDPPPLQFNLALIPDGPAIRPTTTVSPCREVELMPVESSTKPNLRLVSDRIDPVDPNRPKPPADTQEFVDWLKEIQEFGEMTQRRLMTLYAEFCDDRFEPVTPRRLLLQIGACGVKKRRTSPKIINGKSQRIRVYWIPRKRMRAAA